MKQILFLQPKQYLNRLLGAEFCQYIDGECFFGTPIYIVNEEKFLKKFDIVVSCIDHSRSTQNLITIANRLNIKTVHLFDGTYDIGNVVNNPHLIRYPYYQLSGCFYKYILGTDLILKKYFENQGSIFLPYMPKHCLVKFSGEKIAMDSPDKSVTKRVLITTSNSPYFNNRELIEILYLINMVVEEFRLIGISFCFRIYDKKLADGIYALNEDNNYIEGQFEDVAKNASGIITTPSSIAYTAFQLQLPVGLLIYRDVPITQPAGWLISRGICIKETLSSFIRTDDFRMDYQNRMTSLADGVSQINTLIKDNNYDNFVGKQKKIYAEYLLRLIMLYLKKSLIGNQILRYIKKWKK
ncbi:hypothetical protein ACFO0O_07370 [Cobetia amphilecti]|uniref:Capsule polysaccharide biosynthesis protein n=1 Tax=Cobetia amphilecti TaxID=1055104 RepID=A0ABT6USR1_9GAMM|nr:hypothetical protein [Cobetia amphilecti]MDI5885747.1 hypothetical protein [Cobetia amphilecti]